ncbi:hypothetical protein Tco_1432788 [Tanacetum coccineum]
MGRTKIKFDKLIIDIANLDSDHMADSDSCVWNLSTDGSFSVNMARNLIDDLSLPSLAPSTRWYKMIPKKLVWFVMGPLNRMPILSSHVTRLLLYGVLFKNGLVIPFQVLAPVMIGLLGLILGMLLRTKKLGLIPFLLLLVGVFGALETISHSTLKQ